MCTHIGLGSSDFARRYFRNRSFFLFLRLLRCFSSPGSPPYVMDWRMDTWGLLMWVSPFRYPRIRAYLQLPVAFRSLSRLSSALSAKASTLRSSSLNLFLSRLAWRYLGLPLSFNKGFFVFSLFCLLHRNLSVRKLPVLRSRTWPRMSCLSSRLQTFDTLRFLFRYSVFKVQTYGLFRFRFHLPYWMILLILSVHRF